MHRCRESVEARWDTVLSRSSDCGQIPATALTLRELVTGDKNLYLRGVWGDGLAVKMFATQVWGLELRSPEAYINANVMWVSLPVCDSSLGRWRQGKLKANWLGRRALLVSFEFD